MKGTYKYHYIIKRNGTPYDRAQDLLTLHLCMGQLVKWHGLEKSRQFTAEKKRISKEEWKKLYC